MTDAQRARRAAEVQLVSQLEQERRELLAGFDSRRAVLRWGQRIAVRTLGQIPQSRIEQLARSFRPDAEAVEGPLLAAFLTGDARTRDLSGPAAADVREQWAATVLSPTATDAFRDLRTNANEYVGDTDDDPGDTPGYDPDEQAFAMRPALEELDDYQAQALEMALGGFDARREILAWGDALMLASRGEPIDGDEPGTFAERCHQEPSTVELLTNESQPYQRARQAFLARWLLPAFNAAARDLAGRASEEPTEDTTSELEPTHV